MTRCWVAPASPLSSPPRTDIPRGVRIVRGFAPGSGQNGCLTRDDLIPEMGEPAGAATAIEIMTEADASLFI